MTIYILKTILILRVKVKLNFDFKLHGHTFDCLTFWVQFKVNQHLEMFAIKKVDVFENVLSWTEKVSIILYRVINDQSHMLGLVIP